MLAITCVLAGCTCTYIHLSGCTCIYIHLYNPIVPQQSARTLVRNYMKAAMWFYRLITVWPEEKKSLGHFIEVYSQRERELLTLKIGNPYSLCTLWQGLKNRQFSFFVHIMRMGETIQSTFFVNIMRRGENIQSTFFVHIMRRGKYFMTLVKFEGKGGMRETFVCEMIGVTR